MMLRFSLFILVLFAVGCSGKQNSNSLVEDIILPPSIVIPAPTALTLIAPAASVGNLATPTIRVEGVQPGHTVTLYTDSTCTTVLTSLMSTSTSVDITTASLVDGVYAIYATAMDPQLNVSACSTAKADYTLVTAVPVISGVSDDLVARKTKSWSWSCSTSCTYRFVIDQSPTTLPTGAYAAVSSATQLSGDGVYYLHLQASDAAGNESAVVHVSALLDNTAPAVPSALTLVSPVSSPSNVTTPVIRVSGVTSGDTVRIFSDSACSNLLMISVAGATSVDFTLAALSDGVYSFYAQANDALNNTSACSTAKADYTLVTAAPVIMGLSDDLVARQTKNWSWSCSTSCTYRFVIDQSPTTLPSGAYSAVTSAVQSSGDGVFYLHVQAIDSAGNESAVVHVSTLLDNTAPSAPTALTLVSPVSSPSNVTTPVIRVSGVSAAETVGIFSNSSCSSMLGSGLATGTTVDVTTSVLASGSYTFYARSVDAALNASSCSLSSLAYVLDATPPSVVSILAPANGAYSVGSTIDFQLNFSETVTLTGVPCLLLTAGTQARSVCYTEGSGTDSLSFSYTVQAGDDDANGISF